MGEVIQFKPRTTNNCGQTINTYEQAVRKKINPDNDLEYRIERIKSSITCINQLMAELRQAEGKNENQR